MKWGSIQMDTKQMVDDCRGLKFEKVVKALRSVKKLSFKIFCTMPWLFHFWYKSFVSLWKNFQQVLSNIFF